MKKWLIYALVAAMLLSLLSGCRKADDSTEAPDESSQTSRVVQVAESSDKEESGTSEELPESVFKPAGTKEDDSEENALDSSEESFDESSEESSKNSAEESSNTSSKDHSGKTDGSAVPAEPEAIELTSQVYYEDEWLDDDEWYYLTDADYETIEYIYEGSTLKLTCETPMAGIWMIWEERPYEWYTVIGETTITCGQNQFLHEYVAFPEPTTEVTLYFTADWAYLCDIYVFSEGKLPGWVQTWEPILEHADIALFPTHSDDEILFFGGIIPYYAGELGLKVQVIYMTYHEKLRWHELLFGLWTAGATNYPVIGPFIDNYAEDIWEAMSFYGTEGFTEFQVECLRRFKPSVIICHDEAGEYGHGAHCLNTYTMEDAVEFAADPDMYWESYEEYGTWDTPKMYIHMYADHQLVMDWHQPLARFNGQNALEVAIDAYECHHSQHQWAFAVREEGNGDCRLFGLYRTLVGYDEGEIPDIMENIKTRY